MYSDRWRLVEPFPNDGPWAQAGVTADPMETLRVMRKNVRAALKKRHVIELATALVSDVAPRDYVGALCALNAFVRDKFKFVRDPYGLELLRRPEYLLQRIQTHGCVQGDCDDAAQLVATLGLAIGFPAQFCAVSFDPSGRLMSHVFTALRLPNGQPVHFDVTRPAKYATQPPPFTGGFLFQV